MKSAVFIERDGVINEVQVERGNPATPLVYEQFRVNLGVVAPLQRLQAAGFLLVVTTNQPGLSRGYLPRAELDRMHDWLRQLLPQVEILVCPHDEMDRCPCRKPRPGLLLEAAFKWNLDLDRSFVISDKWRDAEAARQVGSTSVLINSPWVGRVHHDILVPSLESAVEKVLSLQGQRQVLYQAAAS